MISTSFFQRAASLLIGLFSLATVQAAPDMGSQPPLEHPGLYPASLVIPDSVMSGSLHKVRPSVSCDGLTVTYWIDASDGTTYEAVGTPMLYQRIAEIYAIAKLREMDSGKEFTDSLGNGAKGTVTAVGKTLSDPGKFIEGIPQGASKFFGSLGESLKGGKSQYEGKAYSNVLGASKAKRMLALQLGVNPYSTNETLQKELNRVGWSEAGGTVLIHMATAAIPAGAGMGLNMNRTAQSQVADNNPEQLNIINRKKLMGIGLSQATADLLIKHKFYSPMHRTAITEALVALGPDRGQDIFLKVASRASSEIDANYFQAVAQLMEKYDKSQAPVKMILRSGRTVSFKDAKGTWVLPIPFDYCLWTESVRDRAMNLLSVRKPEEPLILYTTGGMSKISQDRCQSQNIHIADEISLE